jgi:TM2 domain-containing membrane protein YozV
MKKIILFLLILFGIQIGAAMETTINFDGMVYNLNNPQSENERYVYLLEGEDTLNWTSQLVREHVVESVNPTEAAAELAYKIQAANPGASVLVYPAAATVGYLTFPNDKRYYEYGVFTFKPNGGLGLQKLNFAKRFYSSEFDSIESARQAAIEFAEQYNKKYMEMINQEF